MSERVRVPGPWQSQVRAIWRGFCKNVAASDRDDA